LLCLADQDTLAGCRRHKNKNGATVFQPPRLETFSLDLTRVSAFPVLLI